jgi:hypothetical protein
VMLLLINGFTPAKDDSFLIIDHGAVTGSFSSTNLPLLGGGLSIDLVTGAADTTATVVE